MTMFTPPATLLCDFYKTSHAKMYPAKTEYVYSTWTPRASRILGVTEVVVAGHQMFLRFLHEYFEQNFFNQPVEDVVAEYTRVIQHTLGVKEPDASHIIALHDLGYLPLLIKALPEGTVVPVRTPTLTIVNTHPDFFWITNYIESLASAELWPVYTAATIAHEYRKFLDEAALRTVGNVDFVPFQGHDFSFRGMMGLSAATKTGVGHLLSFFGTDTIPAILAAEHYYAANIEKELVGTSIPASEHSIQCAYEDDMEYLRRLISDVHPSGFVSIVSDGYDFWDVIGRVIPSLKSRIMARDGRVVIRPDSGDPVLIVAGDPNGKAELERKGAVEALWDIFGGTVSPQGFKVLDSHIGLIYGDAITLDRAKQIISLLGKKGFASTNVVFGIGSYTYQYVTRDTLGFALKSTACVIDGKEKPIFKNPKTDDGIKKSQKGAVAVFEKNIEGDIGWVDGLTIGSTKVGDLLQTIFHDGRMEKTDTLNAIRQRLAAHRKPAVTTPV
jgi:nicotinamide phosphoribosyltransferase